MINEDDDDEKEREEFKRRRQQRFIKKPKVEKEPWELKSNEPPEKGEEGRKGPRKKFRWEDFDEEDDEYFYS